LIPESGPDFDPLAITLHMRWESGGWSRIEPT